jgi:hypothetical protein
MPVAAMLPRALLRLGHVRVRGLRRVPAKSEETRANSEQRTPRQRLQEDLQRKQMEA